MSGRAAGSSEVVTLISFDFEAVPPIGVTV